LSPTQLPLLDLWIFQRRARSRARSDVRSARVTTPSDEEDGETLQERFQLRSKFSRPGLPNVPLIDDPPTSLEASLPAPPRRPRNVARKRVAKKMKVTETTSQEVSSSSRVVEHLSLQYIVYADN
jgi:hypothetical protein